MRKNLQALLAQAAELRAVGYTWPAIARRVHRKARTCQQAGPGGFAARCSSTTRTPAFAVRGDQRRRPHRLHALLRSEDEKVRLKAIDLWLKAGSGVYNTLGKTAEWAAFRLERAEERRGSTRTTGSGTGPCGSSRPPGSPGRAAALDRGVAGGGNPSIAEAARPSGHGCRAARAAFPQAVATAAAVVLALLLVGPPVPPATFSAYRRWRPTPVRPAARRSPKR